jgi:hypothetical protein
MIQPKYSPLEALERAKLMMGYDPSTTLTENEQRLKSLIKEDSIDTPTEQSVSKLLKSCSGRAKTEGTLDAAAIASAFNKAFNYQTMGFLGGTDDTEWRKQAAIMKSGNLDDLCNINREFEDLGYGDFAQILVDELDDEELAELMGTFAAMNYRTKKMGSLAVASTEQYDINWFKKTFPCIFDSDGNVDQNVQPNANNYVYILIKTTSGNQYQVFADGRVKKMDGTSTGKKIRCQGSKVSFINESVQKKNLTEQINDDELLRTNAPTPAPRPRTTTYRPCSGTYTQGCYSDAIKKVQGCLGGLVADGKFGSQTNEKLKTACFRGGFSDNDVDKICDNTDAGGEEIVINRNEI